eukprot:gb/GECH01006950.1/.p1 GENE.gb/GECH01006950.1/~~gb/GECH01006950.1/.p1  ORF type:complete len:564 (+),score=124.17 gb/GECH01006950.1/:1-1692(+)
MFLCYFFKIINFFQYFMEIYSNLVLSKLCFSRFVDCSQKASRFTKIKKELFAKVWESLASYITEELYSARGVSLPGFGKFTHRVSVENRGTHGNKMDKIPVFRLHEGFATTHGLSHEKPCATSHITATDLNYFRLAQQINKSKEIVSMATRLLFMQIGEACRTQSQVKIVLGNLGSIHSSSKHVKFYWNADIKREIIRSFHADDGNKPSRSISGDLSSSRYSDSRSSSRPQSVSGSSRKEHYRELANIMNKERDKVSRSSSRRSRTSSRNNSRPNSANSPIHFPIEHDSRPPSRRGRSKSNSPKKSDKEEEWEENQILKSNTSSQPQINSVAPFPDRISETHMSNDSSSILEKNKRKTRHRKGPSREALDRTMEEAIQRAKEEKEKQENKEREERQLIERQLKRNRELERDQLLAKKQEKQKHAEELQQQIEERKQVASRESEMENEKMKQNKHNKYVSGIPMEPEINPDKIWQKKAETRAALDAQVEEKNTKKTLEQALEREEENQLIDDSCNALKQSFESDGEAKRVTRSALSAAWDHQRALKSPSNTNLDLSKLNQNDEY